jgi:hypothetical protein
MPANQLFIAWVPFQRRAISMQPYFGYVLKFAELSFSKKYLRIFEYIAKTFQTLTWLIRACPSVIWVQLPPTLILHILFVYKILLNRDCLVIADCHNATFRKPWVTIPGFKGLLTKCDLVIVHNDDVKQDALGLGVVYQQLYVLEDPPAVLGTNVLSKKDNFYIEPWILCPCSFNKDEPIKAILDAARLTPEITFVLTGNKKRALGNHDLSHLPANIKLPGFLPTETFDKLLTSATIVMGLTILDGIQLSVANEAVGVGQAMVLANTNTLKQLFYKGAVYVDPQNARSIAAGCRDAIARHDALTSEVFELREERQNSWLEQAQKIENVIKIGLN